MSSSEFLIILTLCFTGYGLYRIVARGIANNKRKTQCQNEFQEALTNISDKNLATVLTYMYEQQKQNINTLITWFFIFIFILITSRK